MKKNPFKKQGIMDTAINVGIGGAANVAIDYVVNSVDALKTMDATTINAIKIGVGVLGGTMTTNKMIRAAVDGIAVVGVSNLVQCLIGEDSTAAATSGLPYGTIGLPGGTIGRIGRPSRVTLGNRYFRKPGKVAGVAGGIMGK